MILVIWDCPGATDQVHESKCMSRQVLRYMGWLTWSKLRYITSVGMCGDSDTYIKFTSIWRETTNIHNSTIQIGKDQVDDGKRVGSSFELHECSSLRFGAASAWEFDDVKRVNEKGFCRGRNVSLKRHLPYAYVRLTPSNDSLCGSLSMLTPVRLTIPTSSSSLEWA